MNPLRDERGWAFTGDGFDDPVNGFRFLSEAYDAADPEYAARVSVPVLWDKERSTIVNNESEDILRMLSTVFAPLASHPVVLVPDALRDEIDALNQTIYDTVNNAVYKAGFARAPGRVRGRGARAVRDAGRAGCPVGLQPLPVRR